MSVLLVGSILLMKDDEYGLWVFSEAQWASDGWRPLRGFRAHRESSVTVEQRAKEVVLRVDGKRIDSWAFAAPTKTGNVGIGFKGASGYRSRMTFRDFVVQKLTR